MKRKGLLLVGSILLALVLVMLPLMSACAPEEGPTAAEEAAVAAAEAAEAAAAAAKAAEEAVGAAAKAAAEKAAEEAATKAAELAVAAAAAAAAAEEEEEVTPEKPIKLIMNSAIGPTSYTGEMQAELWDAIEEATGGRVQVEMHWKGELYNEYDAYVATQNNVIQSMGGGGAGYVLDAWDSRWGIFPLPFLFDNVKHVTRFTMTPAWRSVMKSMEAMGLKCWQGTKWDVDSAVGEEGPDYLSGYFFYTDFVPDKLENFAGKKIRVQMTPVLVKMCECLGFQAQSVNIAELPMAMQTGMIEGCMGVSGKLWVEILRYPDYYDYILENAVSIMCSYQFWNTQWYYGLPDEIREIIDGLIREYIDDPRPWRVIDSEEGWEMIHAGCESYTLTAEELARWKEALEPLYAEYRAKPGMAVLFDAVEATR